MMHRDDPEFMVAIIVAAVVLGTPIAAFILWSGYKALKTAAHFDNDIDPIHLAETGRISLTPSVPYSRKPSIESINRENYDHRNEPRGMLRVDVPRVDLLNDSSRRLTSASFHSTRSGPEQEHSRQRNKSMEML